MLLEDHKDTKVAVDTFVVLPPLGIHLVHFVNNSASKQGCENS